MARTLTSATRVLDVMHLLRPEDGIEKYYTVNPGSAFAAGLDAYLAGLGVQVLSWKEATRRSFDLAVSCSVHPTMRRLNAPLMVLPHGAGYNRLVTESTGDTFSPAGLSRRELMWRGRSSRRRSGSRTRIRSTGWPRPAPRPLRTPWPSVTGASSGSPRA